MAKRGRKPKRRIVWESHKSTLISAVSLAFILLSVLSVISIFAGVGDSAGFLISRLRFFIVDGFGFASFMIPIVLLYVGLLFIGSINWKFLNYRIFTGMGIFFLSFLGMFGENGGGFVGGFVTNKTALLLSYPGAVFFYFILCVFAVILISNTGLNVFVEKVRLPFSNRLWEYPPHTLLSDTPNRPPDAGDIEGRSRMIEETLRAFGINATTVDKHVGPAVTRYALNLPIGVKASKVQSLSTDLALRLKSPSGSVRIEAPIPGTNLVGIEVPNFTPSSVSLRSVLESDELKKAKGKLSIAIGHDVSGKSVIQDITRWPHALIAGATGTGKSVFLNEIIATLLFRCSPSECRFIMIDPKLVELSQYNGIPHLLTPVVTDMEQKAVSALAWTVSEMERRYKLFANAG